MKKIIVLVLAVVVFLSGCAWDFRIFDPEYREGIQDAYFTIKAYGHELYYNEDFEVIQTLDDISKFVQNAVEFRYDVAEDGTENDVWSNPEEIYMRGYGDCDDFTMLCNNIAKVMFDVEYDCIAINSWTVTREVREGGWINHMMSHYGDIIYEPQQSMTSVRYGAIGYIYYFSQVFTKESVSYIDYRLTKTYDTNEEAWAKALDPNRSYISLNDDDEWIIVIQ